MTNYLLHVLFAAVLISLCTMGAVAEGIKNPFYAMDTCTKLHYPASDISPDAQLAMLQEIGYKGIAWTVGDPAELKQVIESCHKRRMKLYAHYAGATLSRDKLEVDPRLISDMDMLKGSGTIIWLTISSTDYIRSSEDGDEAAVKGLRALADEAASRKLRIAIYPHTGMWAERIQDGLRLVKKAARKNIGVSFNLCHCLYVGDEKQIPDLLKSAAPSLFMVTLNGADSDAGGAGWDRLIQTLDHGTLDLHPLLQTLKAIRYTGPIGLQGYGLPGDRRDNLTRSMEAWKKL